MQDVSIELPLPAFIPDEYIVSSKEKISVYQRLSGADTYKYLSELRAEIVEDFGRMPEEVLNLFRVLELKIYAKQAGITNIKAESGDTPSDRMIILTMSDYVKPENIMSLLAHESHWVISGVKLKIKFHDLGIQWIDALRKSLQVISQYKELDEDTQN
jgi:transcription-repair coupling factor (superfamily II helicase)